MRDVPASSKLNAARHSRTPRRRPLRSRRCSRRSCRSRGAKVHRHPQPGEERRLARIEPGARQPLGERLFLEVDRDERQRRWDGDLCLGKLLTLPALCRGKVHFERLQPRGSKRAAVGEGVETGAEDHVLPHAALHAPGEFVFGEPAGTAMNARRARAVLPSSRSAVSSAAAPAPMIGTAIGSTRTGVCRTAGARHGASRRASPSGSVALTACGCRLCQPGESVYRTRFTPAARAGLPARQSSRTSRGRRRRAASRPSRGRCRRRRRVEPPRRAGDELPQVHHAHADVAADQVRVAALEIRAGVRHVARQHAIAKARGEALDLRLDRAAACRRVDPCGTWQ